jgi:hypothetical protein
MWPTVFDAKDFLTAEYLKQPYAYWYIPGDIVPQASTQTLNGRLVAYTLNLTVSSSNPNNLPPGTTSSYSGVFLTGDCPAGFTKVEGTINNDASRLVAASTPTATSPAILSAASIREDWIA